MKNEDFSRKSMLIIGILIVLLLAYLFSKVPMKAMGETQMSMAAKQLKNDVGRASTIWIYDTFEQLKNIRRDIKEAENSNTQDPDLKQAIQEAKVRHDELANIYNLWAPILIKTSTPEHPRMVKPYNH